MNGKYAVVVGGINVDICGRSEKPVRLADSNPGHISLSLGGVGRNIAHNLRLLGIPVYMLTALGTDSNADWARQSCRELGIDLSCALTVKGAATSSYLFVEGPEGDLSVGICDAAVAEAVTPAYIADCRALLDGAGCVVMDGNIPEATLRCLAETVRCPIFADPVSVTKGMKLRSVLPRLYALKPNELEAAALTGLPITDEESLKACGHALREAGVQNVYISRGAKGLYALGDGFELLLANRRARLVNTNGCGDAMVAALAAAYLMELQPENTARFALGAAALTVECDATVNPQLSKMAVLKKAGLI